MKQHQNEDLHLKVVEDQHQVEVRDHQQVTHQDHLLNKILLILSNKIVCNEWKYEYRLIVSWADSSGIRRKVHNG